MKKGLLILIVSVLFFLPLISSVEVTMHDSFQQGETIIAKVSGNFITQITKDNIFFYRGHVKVPLEYDVANIGGDFYIYAMTVGKTPQEDYSISIQNVKYMRGAEITRDDIVKNFSITNKTADFSVKPGFVVASDDFSLEVQNLLDKSLTINVNTQTSSSGARGIFLDGEKETSFTLKSGGVKQLTFTLGSGDAALQNVVLSTLVETTTTSGENASSSFCFFWENCTATESNITTQTTTTGIRYELPVYISTGVEGIQEDFFKFDPSELELSIPLNTTAKRTFYLHNTGDSNLENITVTIPESLSSYVTISKSKIENLSAKSSIPIELTFFSSTALELEGNLKAKINGTVAYSSLSIDFIGNNTSSNNTSFSTKTCAELNGTVCNTATETCSQTPIYSKDSVCCLGSCAKIEKKNSGVVIAIIISLMVIIALVWFYFAKYKKAKKPVDLLKISKGKKY